MMKKISFSIWLLVLSASIHAGGDCGTYLAKITWHSKSGPAANLLLSAEAGSYCRFYRCDTEYWIDFICFDKAWSKNDVLQMIDFVKLDSILTEGNFNDIDLCFGSRLKKAIKGNKILYFVRSSP